MKKIGYFGGAFNPPHLGHLLAALYALKAYELDEVWVSPAFVHAFGKSMLPFEQRFEMCKIAFDHLSQMRVVDCENTLSSMAGRSYLILNELKKQYSAQFLIVLGTDQTHVKDKWYKFDSLMKEFDVCWIPRQGSTDQAFAIPNINSTSLRESLANRGTVNRCPDGLDPKVYSYIVENSLYVQ